MLVVVLLVQEALEEGGLRGGALQWGSAAGLHRGSAARYDLAGLIAEESTQQLPNRRERLESGLQG